MNSSTLSKTTSSTNTIACLVGLCMLTTGASGLINEYVLATTTSYILGNSIEQFSVIIALMMFMMGIAGWTQRFTNDNLLVEKFIFVELLMSILGGFAPIGLFTAFGLFGDHFNLVLYTLVSGIGFLIGFEIPLAMRLIDKLGIELKNNLAVVYMMDYVGSFVGAMLWVHILLKQFPLTEISFLVAGLNMLSATIATGFFGYKRLIRFQKSTICAVLITISALIYGFHNNRGWSVHLEQKLYEDPIIFSGTTRYQHLVVTYRKQLDEYRLYINGNTQFSSVDEAIYHEQLVHPIMSIVPDHRNVLILGGGDGMALREVLKYDDVESVTLVDLDPEMIKLASTKPFFIKMNNNAFKDARVVSRTSEGINGGQKRPIYHETTKTNKKGQTIVEKVADVQVITVDADRFISEISGSYNVIIVDLPDPNSIELAKLYSLEFYSKLRKRLAKNGAIVVQSTSPYHAKDAFLTVGRTIQAAGFKTLPYHDNVPSFGDWGWWIGWQSDISNEEMRIRISKMENPTVNTKYFTSEVFWKAMIFGKSWLQTSRTEINTVMNPVLMEHYVAEGWKID